MPVTEDLKTKQSGKWLHLGQFDAIVFGVSAGLLAVILLLHLTFSGRPGFSQSLLYLTPAGSRLANIWAVDPDNPAQRQQITFSETGVHSFAVSPNGKWLVYAEYRGTTRDTHLVLVNMHTSETQLLSPCLDASCEYPAFDPGSRYLTYERINLNRDVPGVPASSPRIWLVDLYNPQQREQPLARDTQTLGMRARWSPDGNYLVVLDRSVAGIRLYDRREGESSFIGEFYGTSGTFSPDSSALIFPALTPSDVDAQSPLRRFDLAQRTEEVLPVDRANFRPIEVIYSPDGVHLAGLHLTPEAECTSGPVLYVARVLATGALQTVTASDYCATHLAWGGEGDRVFFQQNTVDEHGRTQVAIWQYTLAEAAAHRIITDGYHPRWLP